MATPTDQPKLILASASPRRRQLLIDAGYAAEVIASDVDEEAVLLTGRGPAEVAETLSLLKARSVADRIDRGIVLGADTVVAAGGRLYGKAIDADDARRILTTLMHTPHDVITGVTLADAASGRNETRHAVTHVEMAAMSAPQLDEYIAGCLWRGKAGAYGIQDHDDAFIRRLKGSFSNVVGLPMELVAEMLSRWGVHPIGRRA
jgi:septum formation protein